MNEAKEKKSLETAPSFAKGLFLGRLLSERIVPFPQPNEEEQELVRMTRDAIQKFGETVDVEKIEREKSLDPVLVRSLGEMGLFGLVIPEEYGGLGFSTYAYIQTLAALSIVDTSLTVTVGAHQSIGLKALLMFGTDEQKQQYLPGLATGERIAAFGLTEPGAGSDVRSMKTTATLTEDGSAYVLKGSKIWITNGGIANFFTVFARTLHPDRPEGKQERVTAFIVTRDMEGFSSGTEENKMGLVGSSTTSLHFDDVRVPRENVIGKPGEGFKVAMAVLNNGRIGLAGAVTYGTREVLQRAAEHALQRRQFGREIAHFGLIQEKFATLLAENYAAESMVRLTAHSMDQGDPDYSVETAMCKVFCTESEWTALNEALQIAGGTGYMKEYGYEKILRDSRIFTIWEGANEILRLFVGLSGIQEPGERLKEVSAVLRGPLKDVLLSFGVLTNFGVRWVKQRATADRLDGIHPKLDAEKERLEKYVAQFGVAVDWALRKYGKSILEEEQTVARIANIATDLFGTCAVLSRCSHTIENAPEAQWTRELELTRLYCQRAKRRMAKEIRAMEHNDDALVGKVAERFYSQGGFKETGIF